MAKASINQGMDVDLQTGFILERSFYSQVGSCHADFDEDPLDRCAM